MHRAGKTSPGPKLFWIGKQSWPILKRTLPSPRAGSIFLYGLLPVRLGAQAAPIPNVIPDPIGNPVRRVGGA